MDHHIKLSERSIWLHRYVVDAAAEVLGVDLLEEQAAKMRERGYNVIAADAQTMQLGRRWEVIVLGELIEHVEAPGAMLRKLRDHQEG